MSDTPDAVRPARHWSRWLRRGAATSRTIYGTVLAAALVGTESDLTGDTVELVVSVLVSLVVYWLAHVYADRVGEPVEHADPATETSRRPTRTLGQSLVDEWGVVAGGLGVLVVLVVVATAGAGVDAAVNAALGFAVVELAVWGAVAAHRSGRSAWSTVGYALASAVLGVVMVLLKIAFH